MRLFGRRPRGRATRIFYASDVHGSERTWRKFLNAGRFYGADVLIMGGDVIGKLAIPIIRDAGGRRRATIHGRVERLETEAEVAAAKETIGYLGFYAVEMDEDEYRAVRDDPAAVEALWRRLATERMDAWIGLAEARLAGTGIRCYVSGGNDDLLEVMEALPREGTEAFVACEGRAVALDDDHVMVSLPYVNPKTSVAAVAAVIASLLESKPVQRAAVRAAAVTATFRRQGRLGSVDGTSLPPSRYSITPSSTGRPRSARRRS